MKKYLYSISYPLKHFSSWDVKIENIATKCGLVEVGSGAGFGERDIDYETTNPDAFVKFQALCRRNKITFSNVEERSV